EVVIVNQPAERCKEGFFQGCSVAVKVDLDTASGLELHVVQHDQLFRAAWQGDINIECSFANDIKAEVFKQWHAAGQSELAAGMENLQAQQFDPILFPRVERNTDGFASRAGGDVL